MLIAVDHGNKQMKTKHRTFISGLIGSSTPPPLAKDVILYKDMYYALSEQRLAYMRDKTKNDHFFILTLFAIADEIELSGRYTGNEIIDVQLAIGLPPAHYGLQYEQFEEYFLDRGIVEFQKSGKNYAVHIDDVIAFPQAYAAVVPHLAGLRTVSKTIVLDIGGFTADYLQLSYGEPDLQVCDSLEHGVIILYNEIRRKANSEFDVLLDEQEIDGIFRHLDTGFPDKLTEMAEEMAEGFVNDLISKLRERGIDLRYCRSIWTGGGSILLWEYIRRSEKVGNTVFLDNLNANAAGYELAYCEARESK